MRLRPLLACLACLSLWGQTAPLVLKAARMVDVRTGAVIQPGLLWVKDGRIQAGPPPAGAAEINLGNRTLLPGLIDCHTHLLIRAGLDELSRLKRSQGAQLLDGVVNAKKVLEAGFTTVRDVGASADFSDVALRDAIARGEIPGPRMLVAGPALSITGGHGDLNGFPPHVLQETENVVDSPDAARHAVRAWRKQGVDVIKIHATGGVLSNHDDPGAASFSPPEFKAIVEEATRRGLDVCAHAHGDAGILEATMAGVRSIEHGSLMSMATAREMKAHGTFLVPTLYALESILLPGNPYHFPEGSLAKARTLLPLRRAGFTAALQAGVPIAYGTDIGVFEHGQVAADFRYLVSYGMTQLQALQSATVVAARLLRLEPEVGTLEPGHSADVIAMAGNPLEDITTLEHVSFVMQRGQVILSKP